MTGFMGFYESRINLFLRPEETMNGEKCSWYMHNNWYKYCIHHQNPRSYNLFTKGPLNPVLFDLYCRELYKHHKVKEHKYYSVGSILKWVFSCFLGDSSSAVMIALCVCACVHTCVFCQSHKWNKNALISSTLLSLHCKALKAETVSWRTPP